MTSASTAVRAAIPAASRTLESSRRSSGGIFAGEEGNAEAQAATANVIATDLPKYCSIGVSKDLISTRRAPSRPP